MATLALARRWPSDTLNLGSNELIHTGIPELHRSLSLLPVTSLSKYATHGPAIERLSGTIGCDQDELTATPGSDAAIRLLVGDYSKRNPGGVVGISVHEYPAWEQACRFWKVRVERFEAYESNTTLDSLRHFISRFPRGLVALSWPNGPVGWTMDKLAMGSLVGECLAANVEVVVDGCYSTFSQGISSLWAVAESGATVVFSGSKSFGLAGARVGLIRSSKNNVERLFDAGMEGAVSDLALTSMATYMENQGLFAPIWADIASLRTSTRSSLRAAGYDVPESQGNFLHVAIETASKAQALANALSEDGFRTKANTAVKWKPTLRFTVADHPSFGHFLETLSRRIDEVEGNTID